MLDPTRMDELRVLLAAGEIDEAEMARHRQRLIDTCDHGGCNNSGSFYCFTCAVDFPTAALYRRSRERRLDSTT